MVEGRPSAGAVAALAAAQAADLAAQVADSSSEWSERGGALAQADAIRDRAGALASEVQRTYAATLAELTRALGQEGDDLLLAQALNTVADQLERIAETASDAAELAELAAVSGEPAMRVDALSGAILAAAAADIAAQLVNVNLAVGAGAGDERALRAARLMAAAAAARDRARAAVL
jgi:methenyltetrahydrofolate cyclohydrolase